MIFPTVSAHDPIPPFSSGMSRSRGTDRPADRPVSFPRIFDDNRRTSPCRGSRTAAPGPYLPPDRGNADR